VLARAGWDVEARGLGGAPPIRLLANADLHVTLLRAVRLLGLGTDSIVRVDTDAEGSMRPAALRDPLAVADGPAIVCAQAGEVNSGAFDPLDEVCDAAAEHGAWVHVDGAFGLWAAAAPSLRHLVAGVGRADSWATDAHKWLNVPYDAGLAFVAHPDAHHGAFSASAAYLPTGARDAMDWTPESSRRARSFAIWAALRSLGRVGVAEMVERCCACARRFAEILGPQDGVEVLNDVVLQPGPRALRRRRRGDGCGGGRGAGRGDVLDGPDRVARPAGHAHLGLQLGDDVRRRRSLVRCDPAGRPRADAHGLSPGHGVDRVP
jgi:glutamate/tyrosine decarboxylase-like PLP-dependent enzyme